MDLDSIVAADVLSTSWCIESPSRDFICGICESILNDPHQCRNGHCYCLSCIAKLTPKSHKKCRVCDLSMNERYLSKNSFLKSQIDKLVVKCGCGDTSCQFMGPLEVRQTQTIFCQQTTTAVNDNTNNVVYECPLHVMGKCQQICNGQVLQSELEAHFSEQSEFMLALFKFAEKPNLMRALRKLRKRMNNDTDVQSTDLIGGHDISHTESIIATTKRNVISNTIPSDSASSNQQLKRKIDVDTAEDEDDSSGTAGREEQEEEAAYDEPPLKKSRESSDAIVSIIDEPKEAAVAVEEATTSTIEDTTVLTAVQPDALMHVEVSTENTATAAADAAADAVAAVVAAYATVPAAADECADASSCGNASSPTSTAEVTAPVVAVVSPLRCDQDDVHETPCGTEESEPESEPLSKSLSQPQPQPQPEHQPKPQPQQQPIIQQPEPVSHQVQLDKSPEGVYVGAQSADGKKHGFGTLHYTSGDIYRGEWVCDKRHGQGVKTYVDGGVRYDGMWSDDTKHGYGTCTYGNGEVYSGEWKCNVKHGKGEFLFQNGDKFKGDWVDGKKHGCGKITYVDGDVYQGRWKHGVRYHVGEIRYHDGSCYDGDFKQNSKLRHGKGVWLSSGNKECYKGCWKDDKMHGSGDYWHRDGRRQSGVWVNGKLRV